MPQKDCSAINLGRIEIAILPPPIFSKSRAGRGAGGVGGGQRGDRGRTDRGLGGGWGWLIH